MATQTIYLLRHGQTPWNVQDNIHQTHSNGSNNMLTKKGFAQADIIAEILKDTTIDYAFHTPLTRTKQTLSRILIYHPTTKVFENPHLTELSVSFLDGQSENEWKEQFPETKELYLARKLDKFNYYPKELKKFLACYEQSMQIATANNEPNKIIPAWENYADVIKRTKEGFIDEIPQLGDAAILVVGHQGVNRALLGNFLKGTSYLPSEKIEQEKMIADLKIPNASIFRITTSNTGVTVHHNIGKEWVHGLIKTTEEEEYDNS